MSISFKAQSEKLDSLLKDTRIKVLSHNEMKTLSATAKTCVEFSEDLDTITSFITKTLIDNKLKASSWAHEWDQFDTKINDSTDEVIRVEPSIDEYVYSEIDVFLNTIGIKVDCQLTYNHDNAQAINSDIACLTRLESQLEAVFSNPSIHSKRAIASNHTMTRDAIKAQAKIFYDMIQGHIAYLKSESIVCKLIAKNEEEFTSSDTSYKEYMNSVVKEYHGFYLNIINKKATFNNQLLSIYAENKAIDDFKMPGRYYVTRVIRYLKQFTLAQILLLGTLYLMVNTIISIPLVVNIAIGYSFFEKIGLASYYLVNSSGPNAKGSLWDRLRFMQSRQGGSLGSLCINFIPAIAFGVVNKIILIKPLSAALARSISKILSGTHLTIKQILICLNFNTPIISVRKELALLESLHLKPERLNHIYNKLKHTINSIGTQDNDPIIKTIFKKAEEHSDNIKVRKELVAYTLFHSGSDSKFSSTFRSLVD